MREEAIKENRHTKAIGGFLALELPFSVSNHFPPMLSCGRNGLAWILKHIKCDKIYIPFYICSVVPELLFEIGVNVAFYHVNESLEPEELPVLQENEYFLYVNYFGIKNHYCMRLIDLLGDKLILDLTQGFFFDIPVQIKSFSSVQKFFGVTDGCIVTGVETEKISALPRYNGAENAKYLLLRLDGRLPEGYSEFVNHGVSFQEMLQISKLSQHILQCINLQDVAKRRIENFSVLHAVLGSINLLPDLQKSVALCYPCLLRNGLEIKKKLCENKIFIPTYWPHLGEKLSEIEKKFVDNLVCLPIDQRYNAEDMRYILSKLEDLM